MSPDLLAFLFLVTSTAIVLGVAVTLRGLWGLVGDVSPRLPESSPGDASGSDAGSSTSLEPNTLAASAGGTAAATGTAAAGGTSAATGTAAAAGAARDMRESLVMTIGGVFIVAGGLIAAATLINSAP